MDMRQFVRDRDKALLSLDKRKIMAYCRKYGVQFFDNEEVFLASVHKAILEIRSATPEQKRRSAKWLVEHGFYPGIL